MALEIAVRLVALVIRWFFRQAVTDTDPTWVRIRRADERPERRQRYFRGLADPARDPSRRA